MWCFTYSYNQRLQYDSFGNTIKQEPNTNVQSGGNSNGPGTPGDFGTNPLAHLSDSVNSLDPLNAMEKSLNDQVCLALTSRINPVETEIAMFSPYRCPIHLTPHTHQAEETPTL